MKDLLENVNFKATPLESLLEKSRKMFEINVERHIQRDVNWIPKDTIAIELNAGGISPEQQNFIMSKLQTNSLGEVYLQLNFVIISYL